MKNRVSGKVVVMAIVLLWASCAYADILDFFLTDGSNEISFQLDSDPTPSSSDSNSFLITGEDFIVNNTLYSNTQTAFGFYPSGNFGGLAIIYPFLQVIDQGGPQVFTGSTADPTFVPGVFQLYDIQNTDSLFDTAFTLTISSGATAVPEPSTMLLLGAGLLGLVGLKRKFKK